jgi:hypothetical protein
MTSIGKNRYKVLMTTAFASILIVNAVTIGTAEHIAAARHDNTNVFENSHINVQTDTGQRQDCETAGSASPISGSCTASSTDTISQGAPSPCTARHQTVLTLSLFPTSPRALNPITVTGALTDTCTGLGIPGATITFTVNFGFPGPSSSVTDATGTYTTDFIAAAPPSGFQYTVQAHFAGQGIYEPSNSAIESFTIIG